MWCSWPWMAPVLRLQSQLQLSWAAVWRKWAQDSQPSRFPQGASRFLQSTMSRSRPRGTDGEALALTNLMTNKISPEERVWWIPSSKLPWELEPTTLLWILMSTSALGFVSKWFFTTSFASLSLTQCYWDWSLWLVLQVQLGQQHGWFLHCSCFHGQACCSHYQELHDPAKHQGIVQYLTPHFLFSHNTIFIDNGILAELNTIKIII